MPSALAEHTLWEVLELNIKLDEREDRLAEQSDPINFAIELATMMVGGFR